MRGEGIHLDEKQDVYCFHKKMKPHETSIVVNKFYFIS
jgi:hypothetical protein